jgi:hypothetical protein
MGNLFFSKRYQTRPLKIIPGLSELRVYPEISNSLYMSAENCYPVNRPSEIERLSQNFHLTSATSSNSETLTLKGPQGIRNFFLPWTIIGQKIVGSVAVKLR